MCEICEANQRTALCEFDCGYSSSILRFPLLKSSFFQKADDSGCSSEVGFQASGPQRLNLKMNDTGVGCFRLATIMHEFLHGKLFLCNKSEKC